MKGKGKRLLIAFAMTALIFAGSATAYAWFTYQRRLTTITKINAPTALIIGAGQKESSQNIDIGEINVEDEAGKKDFVFSVYSDESVSNYKLQIAHTTNIDFTYTVFPAQEQQGSGDVEYVDEYGTAHYYSKSGSAASGKYLNLGSDGKKLTTVSTRSHTTAIKMCRRMQSLFTGRAMRYSLKTTAVRGL